VSFDALVVLGCSVRSGQLSRTAERRVERAVLAYREHGPTLVVAAGGKVWQGSRECEVFAQGLRDRGVAAADVLEERESLTTRGNAEGVAKLLASGRQLSLGLVTCDWHMPRALILFRRYGLRVTPLPAASPPPPFHLALSRRVRERASLALDLALLPWLLVCLLCSVGCSKSTQSQQRPTSSAAASASPARAPTPLLEAELRRNATSVSEDELFAADSTRRLAAVRSLARIQDERSASSLVKALADEDRAVVAWAAFGLGQLCRGRELEITRRLVLRAASLAAGPVTAAEDDALAAIALGLGRCAGEEAERTLRSWLRQRPRIAEAAALGIGQVARKRKRLDDATIAALLDGAASDASGTFFYPIESLPALGAAARQRLLEVSTSALEKSGPARAFALRALSRGGPEAAGVLARAIGAAETTDAERADAARSLGSLGSSARPELARALEDRARALIDSQGWLSSQHGVVLTLLEGLEPAPGPSAILSELSQLPLAGDAEPVARRKVMLRCRAASILADRASASRALLACDPAPAEQRREGALAQLEVLARGRLDEARGVAFQRHARSSDRVVREAALELLMAHDEVANIPELLAAALTAPERGVRATAAKVLARYPARAQVAANGQGTGVVDERVVRALTEQLGRVGVSNEIELSALLLDAATALELLGAKPALERACSSTNPTLREHAERGFARLREPTRRCPLASSAERATSSPGDVKLGFETDVGPLSVSLAGNASPFAAQRLVELTRAGFYDGMLVHRVVPGFVVQLGDPDGDGFGGPDLPPLRCQPQMQPFDVGSVGMALSGRDTGLSQFFVALRRAPHLDGDYTWVGRAEPGWERLAAGDRIIKARVLEAGAK
jgi:cyclophilin family peptidyl-prolyl cis-trans isomerase/uncharacterized SAM-binding protein YcdF (DUF218 family)